MALVRADRLTATERAMAGTVRGRPRPYGAETAWPGEALTSAMTARTRRRGGDFAI
jgi:hypothetical protein